MTFLYFFACVIGSFFGYKVGDITSSRKKRIKEQDELIDLLNDGMKNSSIIIKAGMRQSTYISDVLDDLLLECACEDLETLDIDAFKRRLAKMPTVDKKDLESFKNFTSKLSNSFQPPKP